MASNLVNPYNNASNRLQLHKSEPRRGGSNSLPSIIIEILITVFVIISLYIIITIFIGGIISNIIPTLFPNQEISNLLIAELKNILNFIQIIVEIALVAIILFEINKATGYFSYMINYVRRSLKQRQDTSNQKQENNDHENARQQYNNNHKKARQQ